MAGGIISSFDTKRGSGFITPDDGTPDVFVHISAVERAGLSRLDVGDRVTFDTQRDSSRDRMFATNLAAA